MNGAFRLIDEEGALNSLLTRFLFHFCVCYSYNIHFVHIFVQIISVVRTCEGLSNVRNTITICTTWKCS
jgi:hypothetical protein